MEQAQINIINEEESILEGVLTSLKQQLSVVHERVGNQELQARELTAEIMNTRRVEDKLQLASDERLAHGLRDKGLTDQKTLNRLIDSPYFGRVTVQEKNRNIEYRLGRAGNPDCRIVDWRRAPIAKLFFEYKEDDEYIEEIQGIERIGVIKKRLRVEVAKSKLTKLECREGIFEQREGKWEHSSRTVKRTNGSLPDVLSLITPEQFQAITKAAEGVVIIEGQAGTGKTVVALSRLEWLLHPENGGFDPSLSLVLLPTPSLAKYVKNTLELLGLSVESTTLSEWSKKTLQQYATTVGLDERFLTDQQLRMALAAPRSTVRIKTSSAFVRLLEEYVTQTTVPTPFTPHAIVQSILRNDRLRELDETKLIDKQSIQDTYSWSAECEKNQTLDLCDVWIVLRILVAKNTFKKLDQIVVDEAQELTPLEYTVISRLVAAPTALTLAGDSSQHFGADAPWSQARRENKTVALTITHRSSLAIARLSAYIRGADYTKATASKSGRTPIFFKCRTESLALEQLLSWVRLAMDKYPGELLAILTPTIETARALIPLLRPQYQELVSLWDGSDISFDGGIIVAPVALVRGLEFTNVVVWGVHENDYPQNEIGRGALYVATSRAVENLCMVAWTRPSTLLPRAELNLLRVHSIGWDTPEEES